MPDKQKIGYSFAVSGDRLAYWDRNQTDMWIHHNMKQAQFELGAAIVERIAEEGGLGTVLLRGNTYDDYRTMDRHVEFAAEVSPAMYQDIVVPRFQMVDFPASWRCSFCGRMNDVLTTPHVCVSCGGSR